MYRAVCPLTIMKFWTTQNTAVTVSITPLGGLLDKHPKKGCIQLYFRGENYLASTLKGSLCSFFCTKQCIIFIGGRYNYVNTYTVPAAIFKGMMLWFRFQRGDRSYWGGRCMMHGLPYILNIGIFQFIASWMRT